MDQPEKALKLLLKSVELVQYNWSAWEEICPLVKTNEQVAIFLTAIHQPSFILQLDFDLCAQSSMK